MARQQKFDWFLSQQQRQKFRKRNSRQVRQRTAVRTLSLETLEARQLLSVNPGQPVSVLELGSVETAVAAPDADAHALWYLPEGETPPAEWSGHEDEHSNGSGGSGEFNALGAWEDQDPNVDGIQLTYSYSNFFDGGIMGLAEDELREATEEALGLWATYAPLHFIEVLDSGPMPDDVDSNYAPEQHPNLRIGHHYIDGATGGNILAHAYYPFNTDTNGLAGDVHFDNSNFWGIGASSGAIDVIEVMTHELGHSLGLGHEQSLDAIMNPSYGGRYPNLGDGFLLPDDINGIQNLYGEGEGSVTPLKALKVNTLIDVDDTAILLNDAGVEVLVDLTPELLTLREAINLTAFRGGRQAVGFEESVFVDPQVMQTIVLDSSLGALNIPSTMTIEGPGSDLLQIRAADNGFEIGDGFRIFEVMFEDPDETGLVVDVSISGLTLTGADSTGDGGSITSSENLTLTDIHVLDSNSVANGGAIYSSGSLTLVDSTVENSVAQQDGGAIYAIGDVTVDATTLYNNMAHGEGGAIALAGNGSDLLVQSSTISTNEALDGDGGGLHIFDLNPFRLRLLNSTVYGNTTSESGGGIYLLTGTLVTSHSIIAMNSSTSVTDPNAAPDIDGINVLGNPQILANYSLIGNNFGAEQNISELAGNIIGTALSPIDPELVQVPDAPYLLAPGNTSPALDSGDANIPLAPEFDQRGLGFDRIVHDVIDIGAIETNGFNQIFIVDTLIDESDGNFGAGDFSLREAVERANASLGPDTIVFDDSLSGGVIDLNAALGGMLVTEGLAINAGNLAFGLTLDAGQLEGEVQLPGYRIFKVDDGNAASFSDFSLENFSLVGGNVEGSGGAIHSVENLSLMHVNIMDNTASGDGGGIYHRDGSLLIENSTIANNTTLNAGDGGGLWSNTRLDEPSLGLIRNSTFSGNNAGDEGGGIFNDRGLLALEHVTITNNNAEIGGGVVSFGNLITQTTVYSSIISGNTLNVPELLGLDVQRSRQTPLNGNSFVSLGYNLIGTGNALLNFNGVGDQTEELDPGLSPLGNNGGKTLTHALLPESKAVDASDPEAVLPDSEVTEESVVVTNYDQRGESFSRIAAGTFEGVARLDIGAFELPTPVPSADFDKDGDIDGTDFLSWQRGYGLASGAGRADGDADLDGDVDSDDLMKWSTDYGTLGPANSHAQSALPVTVVESTAQTAPAGELNAPTSPAGKKSLAASYWSLQGLSKSSSSERSTQNDSMESEERLNEVVLGSPAEGSPAKQAQGLLSGSELLQRQATSLKAAEVESERLAVESLDEAFDGLGFERMF